MLISLSSALWLCFAIGTVKVLISLVRYQRIRRQMPPGPAGVPLLGNLLQLNMRKFPWLRFTEWTQEYGPLFSLDMAGQPVIVLNNFTVTADLTDRRSGVYSDRPRLIMADELMTKHMALPITPYGDLWRDLRKAAHDGFNIHVVKEYRRLQEQAAYRLLAMILDDPRENGWESNVESSLAWTMLSIAYGVSLDEASKRQDVVHYIDEFTRRTATATLPGKYLIDVVPFLERIPAFMNPWKMFGERGYQYDSRVLGGLLNEVRARTAAGGARRSFGADLIELVEKGEITEIQAAWLCGIMFVAGVETTSSVIRFFLLAMLLYPDAMHRAQKEIDAVVGRDRLPTFDDIDDLPYINALVQEVLRWHTVAPLAIPKRTTQDDYYAGYFIPKGTIVFQNVWAMNRDPKFFEDPDVFRPERHLDTEGKLKDPIPDTHGHSHGSFGSGRRICVGRDLAQQSLFIDIATLLWGVTVSPFVNEKGEAVVPSANAIEDKGLVVWAYSVLTRAPKVLIFATSRPAPHPCVIKARFSEARSVIDMFIEAA